MDARIIRNILSYLPSEKIKDLRRVNKDWNLAACGILQNRELIEFRHVSDISKYISIFSRNDRTEDFPYPYAKFYFSKVRLNLIHDTYLLRNFFKKYPISHLEMDFNGPQFRLKYLRMCILEYITSIKSVVFTFKDFYEVCSSSLSDGGKPTSLVLKSVESLTIHAFGRETTLKAVLSNILPYFPSVSRIEAGEQIGRLLFEIMFLNNIDPDSNDGLKPLSFPNLNDINFTYLYPMQLDAIIDNNMKLKCLTGGLHMCPESQLQRLLQHLSPTLEELSLECHSTRLNFLNLCVMPALMKLELSKFQLDVTMLESMPMLKELKLKMVQILCTEDISISSYNDNLISLSLEICDNFHAISTLAKFFPLVRKLELPFFLFDDESKTFPLIYEEFQSLEEIHLSIGVRGKRKQDVKAMIYEVLGSGITVLDKQSEEFNKRTIKVFDRDSQLFLGHVAVT